MRNLTALLLLTILAALPVYSWGQETAIFYANGVGVLPHQARDSLDDLEELVRTNLAGHPSLDAVSFRLSYNNSVCRDTSGETSLCLEDLFEAFLQVVESVEDRPVEVAFWRQLSRADQASLAVFYELFGDLLVLEAFGPYSFDLLGHVATYNELLGDGQRIIVVGHSQGNLFTNDAYALMGQPNGFASIAIASPAGSVISDTEPHLTNVNDPIQCVPGSLSPNTIGATCPLLVSCSLESIYDSIPCHFLENYLNGPDSRADLMQLLAELLDKLSFPDCEPEFELLPPLTVPRQLHCAVLLEDGRVFLGGGHSISRDFPLDSAEVYDPDTGIARLVSEPMNQARGNGVTCVRLEDGRVLVMGGETGRIRHSRTAEIYDPDSDSFEEVGSMTIIRGEDWSAFRLESGKVLALGGTREGLFGTATARVDIFDPVTETFELDGGLAGARRDYAGELLVDERVLLVGGQFRFDRLANPPAEIYTPASGSVFGSGQETSNEPIYQPRTRDSSVANLPSGDVLLLGGRGSGAEIFQVEDGLFRAVEDSPVFYAGDQGSAVPLPNGQVLTIGYGRAEGDRGRIAEIFDPEDESFTELGQLATFSPCQGFELTLLPDGRVLITGGGTLSATGSCEESVDTVEIFSAGCP